MFMKEEKMGFFQWFITILKMDRKKYEATEEEKGRISNKIIENIRAI